MTVEGSHAKGRTAWYIPDAYIPPHSSGELESHESICVLNCLTEDADIRVTIYFEDREPIEDIMATVPGRRTRHIRTSSLSKNGETIPVGVPYAISLESSVPIIVQYSRLDATQPANALMTAIGYFG
ncbi:MULTISPECIES: sensory rhodopsin transducer [unclassified Paenibacillus]|uniref:sensory rhodopsin transducer n=1 Tax=unclassified Paenibacillus TaxID=185978 RepID=UPI003642A539